jgi:hypothetical protein
VAAIALAGCGKDDKATTSQNASPPSPPPVVSRAPSVPPTVTMGGPSSATAPSTVRPVGPNAPTGFTPTQPPIINPPTESKVATFAGLTGPKPVTWIWHPPTRQFSVAEYTVPGQGGADQAQITVSKAGGSVDANIQRWKGQFKSADGKPVEPKIVKFEADGVPITLVELAGSYQGMGAPSFVPDQLFLDAIVETPGEMIFIRFVGPTATVEANRDAFMDMVRGLRKAEPEK